MSIFPLLLCSWTRGIVLGLSDTVGYSRRESRGEDSRRTCHYSALPQASGFRVKQLLQESSALVQGLACLTFGGVSNVSLDQHSLNQGTGTVLTTWISNTALRCSAAVGLQASQKLTVTTGLLDSQLGLGQMSEVFSYDIGFVNSISDPENRPHLGELSSYTSVCYDVHLANALKSEN